MLDIYEMGSKEMHALLQRVQLGHLGCSFEGQPYVLPMHYFLDDPYIYLFTTEGMKTHYIDANPEVCLQVEEIHSPAQWCSVVVTGRAEHLTQQQDIDRAMQLVKAHNPTLSPAISRVWIDAWGRSNVITIYRIQVREMTGHITEELMNSRKLSKASS
jgi:nitroimidazol reductase NimA-like FMN-containing flavoprotein (pyridoxamine 5'-phosphate oxidase superfamily)